MLVELGYRFDVVVPTLLLSDLLDSLLLVARSLTTKSMGEGVAQGQRALLALPGGGVTLPLLVLDVGVSQEGNSILEILGFLQGSVNFVFVGVVSFQNEWCCIYRC